VLIFAVPFLPPFNPLSVVWPKLNWYTQYFFHAVITVLCSFSLPGSTVAPLFSVAYRDSTCWLTHLPQFLPLPPCQWENGQSREQHRLPWGSCSGSLHWAWCRRGWAVHGKTSTYLCVHVCVCVCVCVCMWVWGWGCVCICVGVGVCECVCVCVSGCVCMCVCLCVCTHVCIMLCPCLICTWRAGCACVWEGLSFKLKFWVSYADVNSVLDVGWGRWANY